MNAILQYFQHLGVFGIAIALSVNFHLALLSIRVVGPENIQRWLEDTPLEVVLVNARSERAPDQAQAIAQHNLEGGGELERKNVMASSPAPADLFTVIGEAVEQQERQAQRLLQEQVSVLTQVRDTISQMPEFAPQELQDSSDAIEQMAQRRAMLQQLGAIERRINEENSRPKKRFVSPATKAGSHAPYYAAFRDKVEDLGTRYFPMQHGQRIYGELSLIISIDAKGEVLGVEVVQSSGNPVLDKHAKAIVRSGAPYGEFSVEMLKEFQVLMIASHFRFGRDRGLDTRVSEVR